MQVKKFEARTMKEALELVKVQLGPDAVILSAKEVTKGFGLGGVKSIEITAAYSENVLKQKQYVKSRMPDATQQIFDKVSAKEQKQAIQKALASKYNLTQKNEGQQSKTNLKPSLPSTIPHRRYIDIDQDETQVTESQFKLTASQQIQNSKEILQKMNDSFGYKQFQFNQDNKNQNAFSTVEKNSEVDSLKTEIDQLKNLLISLQQKATEVGVNKDQNETAIPLHLRQIYRELKEKNLNLEIILKLVDDIILNVTNEKQRNPEIIQAFVIRTLLKKINCVQTDQEKFHYFFGPSGSGKTTSLVKLASEFTLKRHLKVAIISTDTLRIGADEQMKIFSQILNVPYISIRSVEDWDIVLPYLNKVDRVLVDFASLNLKSESEVEYLKNVIPYLLDQSRAHLVLSALTKETDLFEIFQRYQKFNISDVIFTSMDDATSYSNILNFNLKTQLPLYAFGVGSRIPDDIEMATPERLIDLIFELTKKDQSHQSVSDHDQRS